MPGALFDQLEQTVDAGRVEDVVAHALQRQLGFLRVHRVDGVPGGQVEVHAGGHRRVAFHSAAVAEQRHHRLQAELFVEVGTADVHAAGGEDVVMAFGDHVPLGRQADQREVRGAAADVDDQHQLFLADGAFVVEGCGNGFVLERHVLEADALGHAFEGVGGFFVGLLVIVDEEHWSAQHHLLEGPLGNHFSALLKLVEKQAEDLFEGDGAAQYGGFAFQQLGAQQAFQRAHQPAFVAFQVLVQGQAAEHRVAFFVVEEQH